MERITDVVIDKFKLRMFYYSENDKLYWLMGHTSLSLLTTDTGLIGQYQLCEKSIQLIRSNCHMYKWCL